MDKLSNMLTPLKGSISKKNKRLGEDIKRLKRFVSGNLFVLKGKPDKDLIFFGIDIYPNIPSRGVYQNLNIKPVEKVFIAFDRSKYPFEAPSIYIDRFDFPSTLIPHLNITLRGMPFSICLTRGNYDEWYAQNGIESLVDRVQLWFDDAVAGELIKEHEDFEFLRIADGSGFFIIDESFLSNDLTEWHEKFPNKGSQPFIAKLEKEHFNDSFFCSFQSWAKKSETLEYPSINGILFFPSRDYSSDSYVTKIPENVADLAEFGKVYGLGISSFDFLDNKLGSKHDNSFIISLIIKRPRNVLYHNSNIEIITFGTFGDKHPEENLRGKLFPLYHRKPVTFDLAKRISGNVQNDNFWEAPSLVVGLGSLGSKVSHHLLKNGKNNLDFCDYDELSPHNLIRWVDILPFFGHKKSELLASHATMLFKDDRKHKFNSIDNKVHELDRLNSYAYIFDFTASYQVFDHMSVSSEIDGIYFRGQLFHDGKMGVLFKEGQNRKPRMDDLLVTLYAMSVEDDEISNWLKLEETKREGRFTSGEELIVGMGCSSDSLVLPDETISLHAALMTSAIKTHQSDSESLIQISWYKEDESLTVSKKIVTEVLQMKFWGSKNEWSIHFLNGTETIINDLLKEYAENETGGILIGYLDRSRKMAYVTHILPQPSDSKQTPYYFERGIKGLRTKILNNYIRRSGGLIDYLGEWHTHPTGGGAPSTTDLQAVDKLRSHLDPEGNPTIMVIATPNRLYPYIYGDEFFM